MLATVRKQDRRNRRKVGIVPAERDLRRNHFGDLNEGAFVAEGELQREAGLGMAKVLLADQRTCDRLGSEIKEGGGCEPPHDQQGARLNGEGGGSGHPRVAVDFSSRAIMSGHHQGRLLPVKV